WGRSETPDPGGDGHGPQRDLLSKQCGFPIIWRTHDLERRAGAVMTPRQALAIGLGLGLGAGVTPGPLLGLGIIETRRGGWHAGILVALAPLVSDLAIIALCFLLLVRLPVLVFPVLGIGGGLYVMFLGWETWRTTALSIESTAETTSKALHSLR